MSAELSSPVSILLLAALQRNRVPEEPAETTTRARTKARLVPFRSSTRTSASIWCTGARGQRNICNLLCPWDQSRALSCCRVRTPSALKSLTFCISVQKGESPLQGEKPTAVPSHPPTSSTRRFFAARGNSHLCCGAQSQGPQMHRSRVKPSCAGKGHILHCQELLQAAGLDAGRERAEHHLLPLPLCAQRQRMLLCLVRLK